MDRDDRIGQQRLINGYYKYVKDFKDKRSLMKKCRIFKKILQFIYSERECEGGRERQRQRQREST